MEEVEVVEGQQQQEQEQRGMDTMVKQSLQKKQSRDATTVTPYKQQLIYVFCVLNFNKQLSKSYGLA